MFPPNNRHRKQTLGRRTDCCSSRRSQHAELHCHSSATRHSRHRTKFTVATARGLHHQIPIAPFAGQAQKSRAPAWRTALTTSTVQASTAQIWAVNCRLAMRRALNQSTALTIPNSNSFASALSPNARSIRFAFASFFLRSPLSVGMAWCTITVLAKSLNLRQKCTTLLGAHHDSCPVYMPPCLGVSGAGTRPGFRGSSVVGLEGGWGRCLGFVAATPCWASVRIAAHERRGGAAYGSGDSTWLTVGASIHAHAIGCWEKG